MQINKHPITKYQAGKYKEGAIKLSANESRFGISPHVLECIKKSVASVFQYPDSGQHILREMLATHLNIKKESLILGNGSDEVLSFICQSLLQQGDTTLSAKETFSIYAIASEIAQVSHHTVPLKHGYFDLEKIVHHCKLNTPKILFLCNPNNPTGTYHPPHIIKDFLQHISHDTFVVLDEAYIDFASEEQGSIEDKLSWHPNIIIIRTFSKLFGLGGLRLGIGITHLNLAQSIESIRMPFNINHLVQVAARASLEDMPFYDEVRNTIIRERNRLHTTMSDMNVSSYPSQANFICYIFNDGTPDKTRQDTLSLSLYEFFEERNIIIRELTSFGLPNAIRITIGTPEENNMVIDTMAEWV